MKKTKLFKTVALTLSCLLGVSGAVASIISSNHQVDIKAEAASTTTDKLTVQNINDYTSYPYLYGYYYLKWVNCAISVSQNKIDIFDSSSDITYRSPSIIRSVKVYFSSAIDVETDANVNSSIKVELTGLSGGTITKYGNNSVFSSINQKADITIQTTYTAGSQASLYDFYVEVTRDSSNIVSFNMQGHGTAPDNQEVADGGKVTKPANPTAGGYDFGGWYKEAACTNAWNFDSDTVSGGNVILYAKWTLKSTVQNAINKINEIENPVVLTDACKNHITAARAAYDAVASGDKTAVSNYAKLTSAEARIAELQAAYDAAQPVVNAIDNIGPIISYPSSGDAIINARSLYNALTNDDQRGFVTNYNKLTSAESSYYDLRDIYVANTEEYIGYIGTVKYPDSKNDIENAETRYNNLHDDGDRALVSNASVLFAARDRYDELEAAYNKAQGVIALIDAIGEVEYTQACKDKIDAAQAAYNALTSDDESGYVTNHFTLLQALDAFLAAKNNMINHVKDLINSIPSEVKYNQACKDAIDVARDAYDNKLLTEDKFVGSPYDVLCDAEETYVYEKNLAVKNVKDLIDGIGDPASVEYTPEYKESINEAKAAYDALLSDTDRALVTNHDKLLEDIERYEELKLVDVHAVEGKISAIGAVSYTAECKAKIDLALNAYNRLDADQKPLVSNYNVLLAAINMYNHVDEVVKKIEAIGEVTLNSGDAIEEAKVAYRALTEEEQALISNYRDELKAKEESYDKAVHNHKVGVTCAIVFGILGGLILLICGGWALMMFVFNKWVNKDGKALRAFKLFGLKKNGKPIVLIFPVRFELREDSELFASKEAALK